MAAGHAPNQGRRRRRRRSPLPPGLPAAALRRCGAADRLLPKFPVLGAAAGASHFKPEAVRQPVEAWVVLHAVQAFGMNSLLLDACDLTARGATGGLGGDPHGKCRALGSSWRVRGLQSYYRSLHKLPSSAKGLQASLGAACLLPCRTPQRTGLRARSVPSSSLGGRVQPPDARPGPPAAAGLAKKRKGELRGLPVTAGRRDPAYQQGGKLAVLPRALPRSAAPPPPTRLLTARCAWPAAPVAG